MSGRPLNSLILAIALTATSSGPALTTTVVGRHVTLQLHHHDRPSLLSGVIHAILQRSFTKGRDLYDLLWYLSDPDWPDSNLTLLNDALSQTGWECSTLTERNWRDILRQRVEEFEWRNVRGDVAPFLECPEELELQTREKLLRLLQ